MLAVAWSFTILTSTLVVIVHNFVLRWLAGHCRKIAMLWVMLLLFLTHIVEIWLFAFAYYAADKFFDLGKIVGCACDSLRDYVYFSATNYTSLGYGDYIPTGALRLLSTIECLVGLMLIGWSTAFAFWWMEKHWLD